MINVSFFDTVTESQSIQILIEGDLLIRDSIEIKAELLSIMKNQHSVEIHFKNIERMDIAALQLLVALSKSAFKQQKLVKYSFEQTEYLRNILNNSGFNKFFSIQ